MTTTAAAVEAIQERFAGATSLSATSICFDNENFDAASKDTWARLLVKHSASSQESIGPTGSRLFQRDGVIVVQLHVAKDLGRAAVDALVDATRAIFESVRFSGIVCRGSAPPREVGNVGRWFQVNVEAAFYYEEVK